MKDYIEELAELRLMLKWLLNKDMLVELVELADLIDKSYVSNYKDIKEQSQYGENCAYAIKAKELFIKLHEQSISAKIEDIYKTFIEKR